MGKLDGAVGYLSGPIEFVQDNGTEWRRRFIRLVVEVNLDIYLIDPTNKPGDSIGEDKQVQIELQEAGRFEELQQYVRDFRHLDLRYTDYSNFLVCVIDPTVPQWGTSNEIYMAESQQKPMFFVIDGGMKKLPRWLFGVIDKIDNGKSNVYESIEEVVERLVALDRGDAPLSRQWVLIRKEIEQQRSILKANLLPT